MCGSEKKKQKEEEKQISEVSYVVFSLPYVCKTCSQRYAHASFMPRIFKLDMCVLDQCFLAGPLCAQPGHRVHCLEATRGHGKEMGNTAPVRPPPTQTGNAISVKWRVCH